MKKPILIAVIALVVAGSGYVTARRQKSRLKFPPHTIVYRLVFYDESEKPVSTDVLIRRVEADGSWRHTQVHADGSVGVSNGKLTGFVTSKETDDNSPEHLHLKYIAERNSKGDTDSWTSPELQDLLMFTTFRENGSKESEMKAVDISRP